MSARGVGIKKRSLEVMPRGRAPGAVPERIHAPSRVTAEASSVSDADRVVAENPATPFFSSSAESESSSSAFAVIKSMPKAPWKWRSIAPKLLTRLGGRGTPLS